MTTSGNPAIQRIGIIAGWGEFPLVVARRLRESGSEIVTVGVADHVDPQMRELSAHFTTIRIGQLGRGIRFFRRHGVDVAVMAGKVFKQRMFRRWAWLQLIPDWTTAAYFWGHFISGRERRNDDRLLTRVTEMFGDHGVRLEPATDYAPDLLVSEGLIGGPPPTSRQLQDIAMAWELAREMGRLDIGQSVAVKGRAVLAVEAIEGTDECIRRAGQLCPAGGFAVVKVSKPHQDMRFDVPTVGTGTLMTMKEAGARVLAIEAGRTIVLGQREVAALAGRLGITVCAFREPPVVNRQREAA